MNKTLVEIRIVENNQEEIHREQVELDPNTSIEQIFDLLYQKNILKCKREQLKCFSETDNQYYNDTHKTIGYRAEKIRLKINITRFENENTTLANALTRIGSFQNNLTHIIIAQIKVFKNNKNIQNIEVELDPYAITREIYDFLLNALREQKFAVTDTRHWNCYSEQKKKYLKIDEEVGDELDKDVLIVDIIENTLSLTLQIMNNELELRSEKIIFNESTPIKDIFYKIINDFGINQNVNDWTCYSKEQKTYLEDQNMLIGKQFDGDTFIVNTAQNAKQLLNKKRPQQQNFKKEKVEGYCLIHPCYQILFICLEKKCCQRKLCSLCFSETRESHDQSSLVNINSFTQQLQKRAEQLILQKDLCLNSKVKLNSLKNNVETIIKKYCQFFEKAFELENFTLNLGNQIIATLENQNSWLNSNNFIEEMVYLLTSNYIEEQILINKMNQLTIKQNLLKFESFFDQFQQEVYYLDFQMLPQYKCDLNFQQKMELSIKYEGKNLSKFSIEDQEYGKYLISSSDIKLEIHDYHEQLSYLTYDINGGQKLFDIDQFFRKQFKIQSSFQTIDFHSQYKNKLLLDPQEQFYSLIPKDVIKVIVAKLPTQIKVSLKILDIKIDIKNGSQSQRMRQSFCENCTLLDIEEEVLSFCSIPKENEKIEIYLELLNQTYKENKQTTLRQILLQQKVLSLSIIAHINENQMNQFHDIKGHQRPNCQERTISLQCVIKIGKKQQSFTLKLYPSNSLEDLVKKMEAKCQHSEKFSDLDIFINNKQYHKNQRNKTLQELGILDNSLVEGILQWTGG